MQFKNIVEADGHILDWAKISNTELNTNTNKGIQFENLIEELIKWMFPNEQWRRTKKSNDGKRDFVFPDDERLPDAKWIECKNYEKNLSINIIAPTLVMGVIKEIKAIYFFSFNPLNENAIDGILRYSKSVGKSVQVFDGPLLDNIIIKYQPNNEAITNYFPNTDFTNLSKTIPDKKLRVIKTLTDARGNRLLVNSNYNIGDKFNIIIILQNLSTEKFFYKIELEIYDKNKNIVTNYFRIEKNCFQGEIGFGSIIEHTFKCEPLKEGKYSYNINVLEVKFTDAKEFAKLSGELNVSNLSYRFWSGDEATACFSTCISHLEKRIKKPLIICGEDGMGKTSLINILMNEERIYSKYSIQILDHKIEISVCVKTLFLDLLGVEVENATDYNANEGLLMLLNEQIIDINSMSNCLMSRYNKEKPFLFIIDDAHEMERSYFYLIYYINSFAQKKNIDVYWIYALNDNIKPVSELYSKISPIELKASEYSEQVVISELKRFTKKDIIAYIKQVFGTLKIDGYFTKYDNNQEVLPHNVYNFCHAIEQDSVILKDIYRPGKYLIDNAFKLKDYIEKYIYSGHPFINYCKTKDDRYILEYIYIAGYIDKEMYLRWQAEINRLIQLGVLKESDKKIIFVSNQIRAAVSDIIEFNGFEYANIYNQNESNIEAKVICALKLQLSIKGSIEFLKEFFESKYIFTISTQRYEICCMVLENFNSLCNKGLFTPLLEFLKYNYNSLYQEQGHHTFFSFLEKIVKIAMENDWGPNENNTNGIEIMAFLVKKYFDRALSTYNYKNIRSKYFILKDKILGIAQLSCDRKHYWLCHYSNRAAIAEDRQSKISDYKLSDLYEESKWHCNQVKGNENMELQIQITIDEFYTHYIYHHSLNIDILNTTMDKLNFLNVGCKPVPVSSEYHIILIEYLKIKLSNESGYSFEKLNNLICKLESRCKSPFYIFKIYLLKIYILIEEGNYSGAYELLNTAMDYIINADLRSCLYKLSCIKAFLLILDEQLDKNISKDTQIYIALTQFVRSKKDSIHDFEREIFLPVELTKYNNNSNLSNPTEPYEKVCLDLKCFGVPSDYIDKNQLSLKSYFIIKGICFPNI